MDIDTTRRDDSAVLSVAGAVDIDSSPGLRAALAVEARGRVRRVVVDLSRVTRMDSSGAATLVLGLRETSAYGGALSLRGVPDAVLRVLRLTETAGLFPGLPAAGGEGATQGNGGEAVIEARGLTKAFDGRPVLRGVDVTLRRGQILVVMGRSGSGKTTCLRILMGQERADAGEVRLFGEDLRALRRNGLARVRRRFGVVFQSGALLSSLSVHENVALPLRELTDLSEDVVSLMVKMRLQKVGLRDAAALHPDQLSGGMRKRVGIARALVMDPEVLFYDEPTAGLDPVMTSVINRLIVDISRTLSVAAVVVTHDMESAFRVADRMIMLFEGRVIAEGTPAEVRASEDPILRQFVEGDQHGPISECASDRPFAEDLLGG